MRLSVFATAASLSIVSLAFADQAAAAMRLHTEIAAQDLDTALQQLMTARDLHLVYVSEDLRNQHSHGASGELTAAEALTELLSGTGLTYKYLDEQTLLIVPLSEPTVTKKEKIDSPEPFRVAQEGPPADHASVSVDQQSDAAAEDTDSKLQQVVVTGSRIRGAPVASPVISQTQEQIRNSGQTSLADFIATIPQNFGGSQNPAANINVPERNGTGVGASSSLDLRGLGGDATLTLLNGHRLAYNAAFQAIDISAIPLAAVDRIEIVADGASALYGSDAVAGVANVILKRDYDGVSANARFGASTSGGDNQREYGIVAGKTWSSGGFIVTYDLEGDTGVYARQRSYAEPISPGLTLVPPIERHNVVLSGHQALGANLTFALDGVYNSRTSNNSYALTQAGTPLIDGGSLAYQSSSFVVAPSLTLTLPHEWEIAVTGTFGRDSSYYQHYYYAAGVGEDSGDGCYCNTEWSSEVNADGALFALPGGDAKVAFGGGIRDNYFHGYRYDGSQNIDVSQKTYYAFSEMSLPLVSPAMRIPLVESLNLSAAIRYENYPSVGHIETPKLGLIYAPNPDFDLKSSWGRSFRAPNFYERYSEQDAELLSAETFGSTSPTANGLLLFGGNPALQPERATTWTATLALHPTALLGARLELSYFHVKYVDRIVQPISYFSQALSNPQYGEYVQLNPTPQQLAAAISGRTFFNYASGPYDPGSVVAIVDANNVNADRQAIHGVDLSGSYQWSWSELGTLRALANASYLHSEEQIGSDQPLVQLAGTVFNPPHWRGRAGVMWNRRALMVSTFINYVGGVDDIRLTPVAHVSSMTTMDMAARYRIGPLPRLLDSVDLTLSVLNVFNKEPSYMKSTSFAEPPYDTTNYSGVGRFVNFGITTNW